MKCIATLKLSATSYKLSAIPEKTGVIGIADSE
jgi:hypothetical protein